MGYIWCLICGLVLFSILDDEAEVTIQEFIRDATKFVLLVVSFFALSGQVNGRIISAIICASLILPMWDIWSSERNQKAKTLAKFASLLGVVIYSGFAVLALLSDVPEDVVRSLDIIGIAFAVSWRPVREA